MRQRHLQQHLERLARQYPVITLTGPRQSGKTTLCKLTFPDKHYVSLEDRDKRAYAISDPRAFLREYAGGAIIDEIQYAPDLTSYIQGVVDADHTPGRFILTGSQNLAISHTVSQSLAGRTAVLTLLPFAIGEIDDLVAARSADDLMLHGFYPRIYDHNLNPTEALNAYLATYVDRDVRQLKSIHDLELFHGFLKLCAGRTAQTLNYTAIGNETGVSHTTVQQWLSILQATYIVKLVPPYFKNFNKRVVRSPKLYFYDVGFAALLLGIHETIHMSRDPLRGALFENMMMMDFIKNRLNAAVPDDIYFFRDSRGNEVDLIVPHRGQVVPMEIKAAATFNTLFLKGLQYFTETCKDPVGKPVIIYGGDHTEHRTAVDIVSYRDAYTYYQQRYSHQVPVS
jgi:uncharacterized protein